MNGDDDGEKKGSEAILKVLQDDQVLDVAVVVSRWFGGTMIGPSRFRHIREVTSSALQNLEVLDQQNALLHQAELLDQTVTKLCKSLTEKGHPASPGKPMDYTDASADKLKRLIAAKEMRIKNLQGQLTKLDTKTSNQQDSPGG